MNIKSKMRFKINKKPHFIDTFTYVKSVFPIEPNLMFYIK